jgi:archaemetzincin
VNDIRIKIIPLGVVPKQILERVAEELKSTFRMVSEITQEEKLPKSAFNQFRNQYNSSQILDFLERHFEGRILGITNEDLYTEGLNFIFGQAKLKGRVAVVSIARLDPRFWNLPEDKNLLEKRAVKECIHEIGHTLGLEHCRTKGCVMTFSNTVGEVDKKTKYLCNMCKLQLGL